MKQFLFFSGKKLLKPLFFLPLCTVVLSVSYGQISVFPTNVGPKSAFPSPWQYSSGVTDISGIPGATNGYTLPYYAGTSPTTTGNATAPLSIGSAIGIITPPVTITGNGTATDTLFFRGETGTSGQAIYTYVYIFNTNGTLYLGPVLFANTMNTTGSYQQFGTGGTTSAVNGILVTGTYIYQAFIFNPNAANSVNISDIGFDVSNGAVLPVSLTSFNAKAQGSSNLLSWSTASESNNKGFALERSINGINFSQIAFVASNAPNGSSSAVQNYSYTDASPLAGTNYYRLKQTDLDGASVYSKIVATVSGDGSFAVTSIYPNPTASLLNISLYKPTATTVTYTITDISGKVISKEVHTASAVATQAINVSGLVRGTYLITVDDGGTKSTSKFTKL